MIEKELKTLGIHVERIEPQYKKARARKDEQKKLTKAASQEVKKTQKDIETLERDRQSILARIAEIQNRSVYNTVEQHVLVYQSGFIGVSLWSG